MRSKLWVSKHEVSGISCWLVFGVLLSLMPLAFDAWRWIVTDITIIESLYRSVIHGEVFIVCVALLGAMIGELLTKQSALQIKIWIGGAALLGVVFSSMAYIFLRVSEKISKEVVGVSSVSFLCMTIVIGIIVIVVNIRERSSV